MNFIRLQNVTTKQYNFLPVSGTTWKTTLRIQDYLQPSEYTSDFEFFPTDEYIQISSVSIGSIILQRVADLPTVESTFLSFSQIGNDLYINSGSEISLQDFKNSQILGIGEVLYFSNGEFFTGIDPELGIEFQTIPRVRSFPSVRKSVDRVDAGKISIQRNRVSFFNEDGFFNNFFAETLIGASATFFSKAGEDIISVSNGNIGNFSISKTNFEILVDDSRAFLDVQIGTKTFDELGATRDETNGEIVPFGYGRFKNVPIFRSDEPVGFDQYNPSDFEDFIYSDKGISEITTLAQINNGVVDKDVDGLNSVVNTTNGTLEIRQLKNYEKIYSSSGSLSRIISRDLILQSANMGELTLQSGDFLNPIGVFEDIIKNRTNILPELIDFDDDILQKSGEIAPIRFYANKEIGLLEFLGDLQVSSKPHFFMDYEAGKFKLYLDDLNKPITKDFRYFEIVSVGNANVSFGDFVTDIEVFTKDQIKPEKINTQKIVPKADIPQNSNKRNTIRKLNWSNLSPEDVSENLISQFSKARLTINFRVEGIQKLNPYDIVRADFADYIYDEVVREFAGVRILKILEIEYDFDNNFTNLTGYDVGDIYTDV